MRVHGYCVTDKDDEGVIWIVTPYCVTRYYPDGTRSDEYPQSEIAELVVLYLIAAVVAAGRAVRAFIVNPPTRPRAPLPVAPIRHGKKRPR